MCASPCSHTNTRTHIHVRAHSLSPIHTFCACLCCGFRRELGEDITDEELKAMIEEFDQDGDGESAFVWLNSPCEWASDGRVSAQVDGRVDGRVRWSCLDERGDLVLTLAFTRCARSRIASSSFLPSFFPQSTKRSFSPS